MWLLTAIGSAVLFGAAGLGMKISQARQGSVALLLLGLYTAGTAGFGIHTLVGGSVPWADLRLWAAGLIIGAGSAWGNAVFMKALEYGPASLTSPLTNMNIALVVLMSTFVYGEPLGAGEIVGILLLLSAVVLISIRFGEPLSPADRRWFGYVAAAVLLFAFRNGGLKVTGEMGLPGTPILFIAYALSFLWFLPPALRLLRERKAARRKRSSAVCSTLSTGWRWGLISGVFSYAGLQLYAVALETGKANIAAPIFATNSLVVAVGAIVIYKEKLTPLQTAALLLTFAGLIGIRLFSLP
jgi:drug/metabolite transporter (DMT)-like permease